MVSIVTLRTLVLTPFAQSTYIESQESRKQAGPVFTYGIKAEEESDSATLIEKLCKSIYAKDSTDRMRTRAMLCHIYHHALHNRWYKARDLMLMSHFQETIEKCDIPTQVQVIVV